MKNRSSIKKGTISKKIQLLKNLYIKLCLAFPLMEYLHDQ